MTSDTTFSNYLLIVYAYSKIPKLYGLAGNSREEVVDNLDMFQSRFGTINKFGWWDLKKNLSRCRVSIDLHEVQIIMPKLRGYLEVSSYRTSLNEWTGQSYIENIAYNFTLSYGTCENFWNRIFILY